jgi:hypothetical protein
MLADQAGFVIGGDTIFRLWKRFLSSLNVEITYDSNAVFPQGTSRKHAAFPIGYTAVAARRSYGQEILNSHFYQIQNFCS